LVKNHVLSCLSSQGSRWIFQGAGRLGCAEQAQVISEEIKSPYAAEARNLLAELEGGSSASSPA
jgi:hypothetical protein